jgi:hypothetical protein
MFRFIYFSGLFSRPLFGSVCIFEAHKGSEVKQIGKTLNYKKVYHIRSFVWFNGSEITSWKCRRGVTGSGAVEGSCIKCLEKQSLRFNEGALTAAHT